MSETKTKRARWWPALAIIGVSTIAFVAVRLVEVWPYEQRRTLVLIGITTVTTVLLLVWWLFFSRLSLRVRVIGVLILLSPLLLFRHRGMTGDFIPIFEFRFGKKKADVTGSALADADAQRPAFPQLFGPARDARLAGPELDPDWSKSPPQLIWKQPIGAGWGAFVVAGNRAVTQEQDGANEAVTCYDVATGKLLWKTTNPGRYEDSIAGIGPRATPTIAEDRVLALGALGTLQCLDLATGKPHWTRDTRADAGGVEVPQWGFASSPLVHEGKVIVSAGGAKSLLAYRLDNGEIAWTGGSRPVNYSSPFLYTLAGQPQIVMFNKEAITAHDPETGAVLWEREWGKGLPHVSRPIPISDRRIFFSSGYGVGSALLDISRDAEGKFQVDEVWRTPRFQSKFATPVEKGGYIYGVSDGIFACLDPRDGTVKWKNGRYGHGQGLLVGDYYLQMTEEPGHLVLLQPTPEAPNELARIPVFEDKTWNPLALSGDLLLMRTDQEAACYRLPTRKAD